MNQYPCIASIHSRRAASPVLKHLAEFPGTGIPVLHWFSGSKRELYRAIDLGCWFSVGPAMLTSEKARALVREMPKDRILTETDGPFAQIKGMSANPWDASLATALLAEIWGNMSPDQVDQLLHANLKPLVSSYQQSRTTLPNQTEREEARDTQGLSRLRRDGA